MVISRSHIDLIRQRDNHLLGTMVLEDQEMPSLNKSVVPLVFAEENGAILGNSSGMSMEKEISMMISKKRTEWGFRGTIEYRIMFYDRYFNASQLEI